MTCVFPCCASDVERLQHALLWIRRLNDSDLRSHASLIVTDAATPFDAVMKCRDICEQVFGSVQVIANEKTVTGWPDGANSLFRAAAHHAQKHRIGPWLWCEPDAVPMQADWLARIDAEYTRHGRRYMGHIYASNDKRYPALLMSGVAVYPDDAAREMFATDFSPMAWDVDFAEIMVSNGANTPLIRHFWGEPGNPPTFARDSVPETNVFSLKTIPEGCVLWHRCKDTTLIALLRERLFGERDETGDLVVMLPFCNVDSDRMAMLVEWMAELHPNSPYSAALSFQIQTRPEAVRRVRRAAQRAFREVDETSYNSPPAGAAPQTWAWRHAAFRMHKRNRPWVWNEADMIPLRPDWLMVLQETYHHRRKPFAGPRVKGMSHANGTSIYAANTPDLLPRTIQAINCIWDVYSADEMMPKFADIGHLMFHAWGTHNGHIHSYLGNAPDFSDDRIFQQIPSTAVCVHRSKDGKLIERLRRDRRLHT